MKKKIVWADNYDYSARREGDLYFYVARIIGSSSWWCNIHFALSDDSENQIRPRRTAFATRKAAKIALMNMAPRARRVLAAVKKMEAER